MYHCLTTLLLPFLALPPWFERLTAHVTLDARLAGEQSPVGRFSKLEHGPACMKGKRQLQEMRQSKMLDAAECPGTSKDQSLHCQASCEKGVRSNGQP